MVKDKMEESPNRGFNGAIESVLSLALEQGVDHIIDDETGRQFLRITRDSPYPVVPEESALSELLLKRTDDTRGVYTYLELPNNYVTLGQALNDAMGDRASSGSLSLAEKLFTELGEVLARVAKKDNLIPVQLSYRNILFMREVAGFKLLPPIEFKTTSENTKLDQEEVREFFLRDCEESSRADQRTELDIALGGFIRSFGW